MKFSRKFLKRWYSFLRSRETSLYHEQWLLGFLPLALNEGAGRALAGLQESDLILLEPPKGMFYADPFLVREHDRIYCFFESTPLEPVFGQIEVVVLDLNGQVLAPPKLALRCDYHLSYPQVIRHENTWYMLPETSNNKTIEIWIAEEFPCKWTRHATLIDNIAAADATLSQIDGRWWLTAAVKQDCKKYGDKLFAWHADSPLSTNWIPHEQNPIRVDTLYDRPAGELFQHEGRLIRPSQDSVKRYGGAIEFREVSQITPNTYSERCVGRLEFPRGSTFIGTHTINTCPGMMVIDLLRLAPRNPAM